MPFSKYFQDDPPFVDHANPSGIQFQLPSFIASGPPTLAPGGGAEVLTFNSAWLANNNSSNGYYTTLPPGLPQQMISAPSPLGLPVYSASGFDILSILARVASRPNPRVVLGPVDMTCSFVVVDVRRHDQPIVYCSPSFCRLTGYPEHEVLGRNCRFLQAPPSSGPVRAGELRRFTSQASVDTMRKALIANKEVQTSIVNFRKDGSAFINLVSVIPILGGERGTKHELNEIVYHVGFQVDLTEQPNVILDKLRDGSYTQNILPLGPAAPYNDTRLLTPPQHDLPPPPPPPQRKQQLPAILMAPSLAQALTNPALHRIFPITTNTTAPSPLPPSSTPSSTAPAAAATNNPLSLILLEYAPDFILVVSLKGAFLYVAPAVTYVLGHAPSALVGRSISDLAHPEDVVPLERQLKESSTLINVPLPSSPSSSSSSSGAEHSASHAHAKLIDVLFRARTARGSFVWIEARGRLHVEPGKGRKAIVLSARARRMPRVRWGDVLPPLPLGAHTHECWVQLSGRGRAAGAIVACGSAVERVLGMRAGDVLGRRVSVLVGGEEGERVEGVLGGFEGVRGGGRVVVFVRMRIGEGGEMARVRLAFYPTRVEEEEKGEGALGIAPPVVLLHIARGEGIDNLESDEQRLHDPDENVFAELEVRRGSSWQYELQQMRFRNARLREEVRALEREVRAFEERGEARGVAEATRGAEVTRGAEATNDANTRNPYPAPCYASSGVDVNVSANVVPTNVVEQDRYSETEESTLHSQQQGQTHADYTSVLERYTGMEGSAGAGTGTGTGAGYSGLEMALGVGMGMDASTAALYGMPQTQVDHRSSFHLAGMYAPRPMHSHSTSTSVSGLLHALGPVSSSSHQQHSQQQSHHHHQQQSYSHRSQSHPHHGQQQIQTQTQNQRQRTTMVRTYDPRTHHQQQQQQGDMGCRRADSQSLAQWGAGEMPMHPGVKRSLGGR